MNQSIFHKLSRLLWSAIVILIVLLAVYVSVGRLLSSLSGSYQTEILQELNKRVPFDIEAQTVSAEWQSFTPVIVLRDLRLTLPDPAAQPLRLSEGLIAIDVAGSLVSRSLQMTLLQLKGLELSAELMADGSFQVTGFGTGNTELGQWLKTFLLNVERLALTESQFTLHTGTGGEQNYSLDLILSREGSRRLLNASVSSAQGLSMQAFGEGVGNPFESGLFSGQLYFDLIAPDVGELTPWLGERVHDFAIDGALDVSLWSDWKMGEAYPAVALRTAMSQVLLEHPAKGWKLPIDEMELTVKMAFDEGAIALDLWDIALSRENTVLQVPRFALQTRGETIKLAASDVALRPATDLVKGTGILPPEVHELLQWLEPRGVLTALNLEIIDINEPAAMWDMSASFSKLGVSSWKNAPAVEGATGYAHLSPGSGAVVLDSRDFSLQFPAVYQQPLEYDELRGSVFVDWDNDGVLLSSGLIEAYDDATRLPAMFTLNIPRQPDDVGIEMDLLVGLERADASTRQKYIPYILDDRLRQWLGESILSGRVHEGGFVWRGSLRKENLPLSTVQLFLDLHETELAFLPQWPVLRDITGVLLIDDTDVSVWVENATMLNSAVQNVSAELWRGPSDDFWLAVNGDASGQAEDGLTVVNESPLNVYTGGAFTDTKALGSLETSINLLMSLTDDTIEPLVEVQTRFANVSLDLQPGNLPIESINGALDFTTVDGFLSEGLTARLWGEDIDVNVGPQGILDSTSGATVEGDHAASVLVQLATVVDIADLSAWLQLDKLDIGSGQTSLDVDVLAVPGLSPELVVRTNLKGVDLNLPQPWDKPADVEQPIEIHLFPERDKLLMDIQIDDHVFGQILWQQGGLQAGSLGLGAEPAELLDGRFRIGGRAAYASVNEWRAFLQPLATAPELDAEAIPRAQAQEQTPLLSIESLWLEELIVEGYSVGSALVTLQQEDQRIWQLTAKSDWLRGDLEYRPDGRSLLNVEYIDLAELSQLELTESAPPERSADTRLLKVPTMDVTIGEIRNGETLLGNVAFGLYSESSEIHMENLSGELVAMQIRSSEPASLVWHQGEQGYTQVDARFVFGDLGDSLAQLGYERIVATENGALQMNMRWPGGLQDFSMAAGSGSLVVDIGAGNFPEVSGGASGALRVVSILNLTEIVQRLSLTHMFDSGVPFDTVNGEMFLQNGVIEVPKMNVEGGGSSFQFSGASDIASRTLSGELVVTLPVASNLPWVAALTAGLPVAAGVYVLSKVFESQVNRLSSAVYTAGGTWDDPQVSFDRVFDDTAVTAVMPRDSNVSGTVQSLPKSSGSQSSSSQGSQPTP
ncbi:MAG: DUF3971 domain-containing protein [Pseudomonadota bacterium]